MEMEKYVVYPQKDHDSIPYWEHLKEHKARLQKCEKCGRFRFPPYPSCPYCGVMGGNWEPISGKGAVYSWITIHHAIDPRLASETPFVIVLVDLEEGPRVTGRLVGCNGDQMKIGMQVKALYDDIDAELTLLNFEPVA